MIERYPDPYDTAVRFVVSAAWCEDHAGVAHFTDVAFQLMQRGYHKTRKLKLVDSKRGDV
jgi:hypothetical protein